MIKDIKLSDGTIKKMVLGFLALKEIVAGQERGLDSLQVVENAALAGFQAAAKREGTSVPTREEMQGWFDDTEVFLTVKEAVEDFSVNFSKEAERLAKKKKK